MDAAKAQKLIESLTPDQLDALMQAMHEVSGVPGADSMGADYTAPIGPGRMDDIGSQGDPRSLPTQPPGQTGDPRSMMQPIPGDPVQMFMNRQMLEAMRKPGAMPGMLNQYGGQ